jgi:hypothetical protein
VDQGASTSTFSGSIFDESITFTPSGDARIPEVYLPAGAFSPQLMLRWPLLVSEDAPKGRLQPYLGGGPAWAFTWDSDEPGLVLGGLVRGGIAVQVFRYLALFTEYRYSLFPGFEVKHDRFQGRSQHPSRRRRALVQILSAPRRPPWTLPVTVWKEARPCTTCC